MTLDELIEKVPERFRPVARQYGPALLAMTADELWAWIDLLVNGKTAEAYRAALAKLDDAELLAQWDALNRDWADANRRNAARIDLQQRALTAVLQALLAAAVAMVGL